jgi:hypothetical protein
MSTRSPLDEARTCVDAGTRRRTVWMVLRLWLVLVVAALVGLAVLIGAAALTPQPVLFLGAGLVAFLTAVAGGVALATRRLPAARRATARQGVRREPLAGAAVVGRGRDRACRRGARRARVRTPAPRLSTCTARSLWPGRRAAGSSARGRPAWRR